VIRYNLKKTPGYMFRPSLGHTQANTNIIKNIEVYSINQILAKLEETQTPNLINHRDFYPRVVNKTNISFTPDELTLLGKGLKYNLSYKPKDLIQKRIPWSTLLYFYNVCIGLRMA
jgi:hypothetical protein